MSELEDKQALLVKAQSLRDRYQREANITVNPEAKARLYKDIRSADSCIMQLTQELQMLNQNLVIHGQGLHQHGEMLGQSMQLQTALLQQLQSLNGTLANSAHSSAIAPKQSTPAAMVRMPGVQAHTVNLNIDQRRYYDSYNTTSETRSYSKVSDRGDSEVDKGSFFCAVLISLAIILSVANVLKE